MASTKPLRDKVVVERSEAEERTAGGIVLPDTAKDKPKQGKVIAVGTGRVLDNGDIHKLEVKKGDTVLFGGYAGSEVKIDGQELLILAESEILAVVENGKK
jgi:chaperonin GroES